MSDQMNNQVQPQQKTSPLAVAALVLAIIALIFPWVLYAIPSLIMAITALILSIVAKKQGVKGGMVTAAMVISIIAIVSGAIFLVACLTCMAVAGELEGELDSWAAELEGALESDLADW